MFKLNCCGSTMSDSDKILQDMEEGGDSMTKYGNMILEFVKKEVFQDRKNVSVEEIVTLVAALTDLSVSLLAKFRKEPIDPLRATDIGRDVFKHMVGKIGFDVGQLGKSSLYA
jgi:hypothetical protein